MEYYYYYYVLLLLCTTSTSTTSTSTTSIYQYMVLLCTSTFNKTITITITRILHLIRYSQPTEGRVATPTQHTLTTITSLTSSYSYHTQPADWREGGYTYTAQHWLWNLSFTDRLILYSVFSMKPTLNYTVTKAAKSLQFFWLIVGVRGRG